MACRGLESIPSELCERARGHLECNREHELTHTTKGNSHQPGVYMQTPLQTVHSILTAVQDLSPSTPPLQTALSFSQSWEIRTRFICDPPSSSHSFFFILFTQIQKGKVSWVHYTSHQLASYVSPRSTEQVCFAEKFAK